MLFFLLILQLPILQFMASIQGRKVQNVNCIIEIFRPLADGIQLFDCSLFRLVFLISKVSTTRENSDGEVPPPLPRIPRFTSKNGQFGV